MSNSKCLTNFAVSQLSARSFSFLASAGVKTRKICHAPYTWRLQVPQLGCLCRRVGGLRPALALLHYESLNAALKQLKFPTFTKQNLQWSSFTSISMLELLPPGHGKSALCQPNVTIVTFHHRTAFKNRNINAASMSSKKIQVLLKSLKSTKQIY